MKDFEIKSGDSSYPVRVGTAVLPEVGKFLHEVVGYKGNKVALVTDETVAGLYGKDLIESLELEGFVTFPITIAAGEEQKHLDTVNRITSDFARHRLTRSDLVISLGGGVVGDIAGFAASIFMRGVDFVQVPTTLLAMVDSSVGGKTGVNTPAGKNLIGAFHNPAGVLTDVSTLRTLDPREMRAGYYEVIKHGAIGGQDSLTLVADFLKKYPGLNLPEYFENDGYLADLTDLVSKQVNRKAKFVANDANEDPERIDSASRKVLNFGHTVGHALEKVTKYRYFRHGEAVAYGILTANQIAKKLEFCDITSINLLNDVVLRVGSLPDTAAIDIEAVCDALLSDKKAVGGSLQWILLERLGIPRVVSEGMVPESVVRESLSSVLLSRPTPDMTKE
ncbi:MAG: 3-dehydroquinate synthase [Pyrinomonadaceae bacterium]|nr:3-dehydroquinate synthase [Pyrinomonadaceae bacterium]